MLPTGSDLLTIERTIQLAIAPAFLLAGVFSLLTLLTNRLQRLTDSYETLQRQEGAPPSERRRMVRRVRLIHSAITFAMIAACLLCILVVAGFLEPLAGVKAGMHIVVLMVGAIAMLTGAIVSFLMEVLLSTANLPLKAE